MSIQKYSSIMVISKLSKSLLDVFSIMILSRYLLIDQYGFYRQFLVSQQILIAIISLGIPASTMYFLSSEKKKEYLPNVYFVLGLISFSTILLSPLITKLFDLNFDTSFFQQNLLKLSFIYALSVFVTASENMIIALKKIKYMPIYILIPNIFWLLGVFLSWVLKKDLDFVLMIFLIRFLLYFFITIIFIKEKFEFKYVSKKRIKDVFLFGLPVGVSSMIGLFSTNIDKLVIGNLYDTETFAIFSNGAYEIPFLGIIGGSLFNVMIPSLKKYFDDGKKEKVNLLWNKAGWAMITIIIPIASIFIIFSETAILFLFSEKYLESVPFFRLYQVKLFFRIFLYGSFFISAGKSRLYMYNAAISMFLNLILDIILVIYVGPIGAVIATVISTFALVILQIFQISRILKLGIKDVFPWKKWSLSIIITLLISFIFYYIYNFITDNVFVGLGFMALSFLTSFIVLSKFIDDQILKYFFSLIRKRKASE